MATIGGYSDVPLQSYYYVKTFKLEYSNNSLTWEKYRENDEVKVSRYV